MEKEVIVFGVDRAEYETIKQALYMLNNHILNELYMNERNVIKATSLLKESVCYQLIQKLEGREEN